MGSDQDLDYADPAQLVGQRTLYSDLSGTTWITSCGDDANGGDGNISNKETTDGVNDCWASCTHPSPFLLRG